MADQLYGGTNQTSDILRRIRQYNALRGTDMPQSTQSALFEGMGQSAAEDASRRYYQGLATQQANRTAAQRDKALKMQQEAQDAQSLQGWLGLGYKGLGGEQGIKDLWGKASDWWTGTDVPAAYNPSAASAYDLGNYSVNSLSDSLGIQPETAKGLLGDYLGTQGDYSAFTMGVDNSGVSGVDSLGGGAVNDILSSTGQTDALPAQTGGDAVSALSGSGLPTIGATGGGLGTIDSAGLINEAVTGGYEPWSATGEALYPTELWDASGALNSGVTGGSLASSIPWGSGALAGGASVVSDLLSGGDVNIGKAAGATGGGIGGAMLGTALTGGNPIGTVIGSILGGGGGSLLGGGGSVLCTELHRQGKLNGEVYSLDSLHGLSVDAVTMLGYHSWGIPVAKAMSKSPVLTAILAPLIRAWAYHMAAKMMPEKYQPNSLGRALYKIGVPLCRWLGRRTVRKMRPQEV